jgi:hypothetical protein
MGLVLNIFQSSLSSGYLFYDDILHKNDFICMDSLCILNEVKLVTVIYMKEEQSFKGLSGSHEIFHLWALSINNQVK